jgi:hypothetical protein
MESGITNPLELTSHDVSAPMRFSWPMRIFLAYFLIDMVMLSFLPLTPYVAWMERFSIATAPDEPMPSPAEIGSLLRNEPSGEHHSLTQRTLKAATDVTTYYVPKPKNSTEKEFQTPSDYGQFIVAWIASRLRFTSRLVGVNQGWPMYTPGVAKSDTIGRLRLVFADGSTEIHRSSGDPKDLTQFSRWWNKRPLQFAVQLGRSDDARRGYSHWIANLHPTNPLGSELVRIEVFTVEIRFPGPYDDIYEFFASQNTPLADDKSEPVWVYDVATKSGRRLAK